MPETIATITAIQDGWRVRSPSGLEVVVDDVRFARYEIAKLIDPTAGTSCPANSV
ncbi:hypothetical protein [Nocardia sp. XZ_19_385]|uniref:hypothetical protein n=1 Tax=Nocardia sp. XZ_19_385 TaxID=2769488 RepID=UPI0018909D13|nr:hypothetical protein [Nocardia sp. XZ_19_385]